MEDFPVYDEQGNLVSLETRTPEGEVLLRYDFVAMTCTNYTAAPEEQVQPIGPEVLAHFSQQGNKKSIEDKLLASMDTLTANLETVRLVLDTPNSSITFSGGWVKTNVIRPLRDIMMTQRMLVREVLQQFSDDE